MQTIEINTTQNVTIQYELALLRDRIFAWFIDFVIIVIGISILIWGAMLAFSSWADESIISFIIVIPILFGYTLVMEIFNNGQTVGKLALGIKVVKLNGKEPELNAYLLRWVFRMIDIYGTLGIIASLFIGSSNNKQRIGDVVANTTLIKTKPYAEMRLPDLLSIKTLDNHTPTYPEVAKLSEADMLLVKEVLDQYQRYPNQAHRDSVLLLIEKIQEKTGIEQIPNNKTGFLRVLISDYIVLTR